MNKYTIPNITLKFQLGYYLNAIIVGVAVSDFLILLIEPTIENFIWASLLGISIGTFPLLVWLIGSKRRKEYGDNIIEIKENRIVVKYFNGDTKELSNKKVYNYMELRMRARTLLGISKIGIRYLPREFVEKYNSTFGMKVWLPLGVGTKEQYEILRREIEEFKKRNNITGCKPKKGGKS